MRLLRALILVLVTAAVMGGFALFMWASSEVASPGPLREAKIVMIQRGKGVSAIARHLEGEGVIRNAFLFRLRARLTGTHRALKAGEYEFTPRMALDDVLAQIAAGAVFQRLITVPEGLTSWQVTEILNGVEDLAGEVGDVPAEGSILPETYDYMKGDTRAAKIAQMQKAMQDALDALWPARAPDLVLSTPEQAVILASIVEKETGHAAERARIAGVFYNRLAKGMPLQSDPTVIYALTDGRIENKGLGPLGRRLLRKDLEIDSPYNTYRNSGLPPGPIANPGRAALEATLNPEKHDYLYFVADKDGGHAFARTLAEHNANVAGWRRHRRQSGQ